ncbi:hypothetical protein [Persephonella sp.]
MEKIFTLDDNIIITACYTGKECEEKIIHYLFMSSKKMYVLPSNRHNFWCLKDEEIDYEDIPKNVDIMPLSNACDEEDIDLNDHFDGDDDKINDINLLAFSFNKKNEGYNVVIFSKDERVKDIATRLSMNFCCLIHFCKWLFERKEIEEKIYNSWMSIIDGKFSPPNWKDDVNWQC